MVLGDGQRLRGAICDAIAQGAPGVGFVRLDGSPDPTRVRASFVTTDDIAALVAAQQPPRTPLTLVPPPGPDTDDDRSDDDRDEGTTAAGIAA